MKKIFLLFVISFLNIAAFAQIPIAYWSFEDATHAAQSLAVTDQMTGANGAAALNVTGVGGCTTTSATGAGTFHGGLSAGLGISSSGFPLTNTSSASTVYWQFAFTNTATSGLMTISFDVMVSTTNLRYAVLYSTNGGASYASGGLSAFGALGTAGVWTTITVTNIPAGTNAIAIYGYSSAAGTMTIDNVSVMASFSATTAGGVAFTTADEADIYNMVTSGNTGGQIARTNFTVQGAATDVTINNNSSTSGVSISNSFQVLSGTLTLPNTGIISGAGSFGISPGATLATANTGGIAAAGTASGSIQTNARLFVQGATYIYNGNVPQITGTGLPNIISGTVIIDNNGSTVTLTQPTTFNALANLDLENGTLVNSGTNVTMLNNSNVNVDNGTLAVAPTANYPPAAQSLNLTYMNLGYNNLALTTGNEWPSPLTALVTVNHTGATITLNSNKVLSGSIVLDAGILDASASNYNLSYTGGWTNNASTSAFNARNATVTFDGSTFQTLGGSFTTTFNNYTLAASPVTYLTLGNTENVFGTLTLNSGRMVIGANNLVLGTTTPAVAGTPSSTSLIIATSTGEVQKLMTGNGAFLYPVGDPTGPNYSPITLSFTAGIYAAGAYAGVNLRNVKHPNNADLTNYIKRYWSVALSGITAPAYSVTATYVSSDVVPTEANIVTGQWTGALPWITLSPTNTATHTLTTSTTVSNITSDFSGISNGVPTAVITSNGAVCTGSSLTLSGSSSSGNPTLTYAWAPAATLSATTGVSVTATPTITTTYTLTVTDGNGITNSTTATITVDALPPAISGNTLICGTSSTTLTDADAGGTWSSSSGNITVGSSSGVITGVSAGTALITYTAPGNCTTTTVVLVNSLPNAGTITGPTCVQMGNTITLSDAASPGWVVRAAMTSGLEASAVAVINDNIYVMGGSNSGASCNANVEVYNATTNTWTTAASMPACRYQGDGAGVINGLIYCPGGWTTSPPLPNNNLYIYNPATNTWSTGASMPGLSADGITGVINNILYVTTAANGFAGYANYLYSYDPTANAWTTLATSPVAHSSPAGGVINGKLYVAGGFNGSGIATGQLDVYDPGTSTWSTLASMPMAEYGGSSGVMNGLLYVVGGHDGSSNILDTMFIYNPVTNTWSTGPSALSHRELAGGAVANGSLYFIGGDDGAGTLTNNEAFTPYTWSSGNTAVATISQTGIVAGETLGSSTISFTAGGACTATSTYTVTVYAPVTGTPVICNGLTTTLSDLSTGGTWSSSNGNAIVGSLTGIVTGTLLGSISATTTITYALSPSGCTVTDVVTIDPNPTAITGSLGVCLGATTTLNSTPAGGTWSSSNADISIGSSTGAVTGLATGTSIVTYTLSTGCINTAVVTVNPNPTAITGTLNVCVGLTTTLNSTPAGGTWSSSNTNASVGSATGVVTGVTAGTAIITYSLSTGCNVTAVVTINTSPGSITGTKSVCIGAVTALTDAGGGTWASSTLAIGTVDVSGNVAGIAQGTTTISYTLGDGCMTTTVVTVYPIPATITGTMTVCVGLTTTLNTTPAGGIWSSSNGNATAGSATGVVTGVTSGTSIITYTLGSGCNTTTIVTVNPNPTTITGTLSVCVGLTTTLNSTPAGGIWTSSNANATVGSLTGIVTGNTAGTTSTITYTINTGCINTAVVTINPNPTTITGTLNVCVGLTTTLNSTPAGGTWSSSSGNATVVSTSGVVTGAIAGTSIITYTLSTGCINTTTVTINPNPTTITGNAPVCVGLTTTLNSTPAGGNWTSSNGNATVGSLTGIVTGIAGGTSIITYTINTGCIITAVATVNSNPTNITGSTSVCTGLCSTLNSTPAGGTWTSSNTIIATVSAGGVYCGLSNGTSAITYTLGTGCINSTVITVNPNPTTISGNTPVCVGLTVTLNSTPAGGTWSSSNGNATVGSSTGIVTGVTQGTATITYTLNTGCIITAIVTINPNPTTITGNVPVCIGLTTTLNSTPASGTWTSSNGNATIGSINGIVTGIAQGTAVVTYTLNTGCINTTIVTINPNPTAITGLASVCTGLTTTLNSTPAGGTWSVSNGNATIGSSTGIVTGITAGTTTASYVLSTGCLATIVVTINQSPGVVTGTKAICIGATTALTDAGGGTWVSSIVATGTVDGSGNVTGIASGATTISYTLGDGCSATAIVTVYPNPTTITGTLSVCVGLTTSLNSTPAGGTWASSSINANVTLTTGVVTGALPGTANITYTIGTGCTTTTIVTVNPNPTGITGNIPVCIGLTTTLNSTPAGGTWTSSNGNTNIGSVTGVVTGVAQGTSTITYTISTGCINTAVVTVNPNPTNITGNVPVCVGLTITLNSTPAGGTWTSSNGNAFAAPSTGIITGISQGTATITYTLSTGCINTTIVTVNPNPTNITGNTPVCVGSTTTLNSTPASGTWTSSNGNTNIGSVTGVVTGVAQGTSTITYTISTGCINTAVVTVNPNPTNITGNVPVCVGLTITLNSTPAGGTWTSSNGNALAASSTGIITGVSQGTATITYTLNTGCINTTIVTVNPNPTNITGTLNVCVGLTTILNSTPAGGTWASSNGNTIIGSATGIATGSLPGTSTITYTLGTGCINTAVITVNPNPTNITGTTGVCIGLTTTLNSTPAGGTWTSSNGNATIGSLTGVVTGVSGGTSTMTYTLSTGCINTITVTVNSNPTNISGPSTVCVGSSITLGSTPTGGIWSSSNTNAFVVGSSGVVTGVLAGTSTITYSVGSGCFITTPITVNPLPAPISGTLSVCIGSSTTLTDAGGGTWSLSNGNAIFGSAANIVTGITAGTDIITYTLPTTCIATAIVTVYPLPGAIMGTLTVCSGLTTSLSDTPTGGTWSSSSTTIASIGSASGIMTGGTVVALSTATITYTIGTGCTTTTVVTVNPLPSAISGTLDVCVGLTTALTDVGGGTWGLSNGNATIVTTTGVVTGEIAGLDTAIYTLPTGCIATAVLTVNPLPTNILGNLSVCSGLTTTLSDLTTPGTWSISATTIASIDPTSGVVTAGTVSTASTAIITYTIGTGCYITAVLTVNPLPTGILGNLSVCPGTTTQLSDLTAGGTWSSSASGIAGINTLTGLVTGVTAGTTIISYILTSTGCMANAVVTVNPLPSSILGNLIVCANATTTLSDTSAGGVWTSSPTSVATIGVTTGIVTGGSVGAVSTATITYTLPTTCMITAVVTVDPVPVPITGTQIFCAGVTTTLNDLTAGGTWSSSDIYIAPIGLLNGVIFGSSGGTVTISYTLPSGCFTTTIVTVEALPGAILGDLAVCQGLTTSLSDLTPAGTWSITPPGIATITPAGLVTGSTPGTTTVSYTLSTGCASTAIITVNPLPSNITGTMAVCFGLTTTLSDITTGGTWSTSDSSIASVGSTTGVVMGNSPGTVTITYTLPTGCIATTVITVNPLPSPISGSPAVCIGLTTSLSDVGGGTWTVTNGNATIGLNSGVVMGVIQGLDTAIYTLPTGCVATVTVTVYPLPVTITGNLAVCAGSTSALTDSPLGGTWSSSDTSIATIDSVTGIVTGAGVSTTSTAIITYNLASGCIATAVVTVNPLPVAITGITTICVNFSTTLADATGGGTWSSGNPGVGSIGTGYGEVTGVAAGITIISYTLLTGCYTTTTVTVTPPPSPITGDSTLCFGTTTELFDLSSGGTWSSGNTSIATVGTSGVIVTTGSGTVTIMYTLSIGCTAVHFMTINPLPAIDTVKGGGSYCQGGSGVDIYTTGSNVGISYLLYYDSSVTGYLAGTGSPLNFGLLTVAGTYTVRATNNTTGCSSNMIGTVNVTITPTINPTVSITVSPGDTVCPGTTVTFKPSSADTGSSPIYKWSVNGVLVSISHNYAYIPANGDVVTVQLTSNAPCIFPQIATDSIKVHVLANGNPQVVISAVPGDTVCQYSAATFTATPIFGGPDPTFVWYVNGFDSGSGPVFTYYPTSGDVVTCIMTSDYQCRTANTGGSNMLTMVVEPMIIPHVEVHSSLGFDIIAGESDTLRTVVTNAGPDPAYQWEINGLPVLGATADTFVGVFHNYDSVTCLVTSSGYCEGITTFGWIYITVHPVGIQQYSVGNSNVQLIPNPNNGIFTLKGTLGTILDEEATIDITDMAGQIVYKTKVMVHDGIINEQIKLSSALPNGMYLLNLQSGSDNKVFHFVIAQ